MNEQEKIDHAIAMLQALRDGKRVEGFNHEAAELKTWFEITRREQLLNCLVGKNFATRIAPEPLEEWKVVWIDVGCQKVTMVWKTKEEAKKYFNSCHPDSRPELIHMRQVMT